jgi:hypothetical protein
MFRKIPIIEKFIQEHYTTWFSVFEKRNGLVFRISQCETYKEALHCKQKHDSVQQNDLFEPTDDNIFIEENIDKFPYIEEDEIKYLEEFKTLLNDYIERKKPLRLLNKL